MIPTWWSKGPVPGNLGDVLTPYVMAGMGVNVEWAERSHASLLCIGSIARFACDGQTVIGSGIMWEHDTLAHGALWKAVRGPLTRKRVQDQGGECPEVYGDPALLLPDFHNEPIARRVVGLVPHYIDWHVVQQAPPCGVRLINPLNANPLAVVDQIRECEVIYSSSLHGIIVAHAYGIPAAWVRFGDRLDGDDVKFRDYAESVGIDLIPYRTVSEAKPVLGSIDLDPLRRAFAEL